MIRCVTWVEAHKDFFLVIAALLAPFAAVLIGLVSSKWQAVTMLKSTRMQIRASALRDYRQRNVEKLREEIAAEIFYVSQLRFKQQDVGLDNPKARELVYDAMARKIRIRVLQSAVSSEQLKQCFKFEENLVEEIGLKPARQSWGLEENTVVNRKIDELGNLYLKVLESESQAAAEQSTI
jgi:hypothetical protein